MRKNFILCVLIVLNVNCYSQQKSTTSSNNNEEIEFQNFLKEFKEVVIKNDIVKVKSMIRFPIIITSMGSAENPISQEVFGIGANKYFDLEFVKQIKLINEITKTEYPENLYGLFSLPKTSILYQISLPNWHMSYSYLYMTKIDGKITIVGENYGSAD